MLSFIKRIYRSLKYRLVTKPSELFNAYFMSIGKTLYIKFLNSGERYDPSIAKMMKLSESSHVKRYEFVKQFINKENTVLDIACGTGYGSKIISSNCKYIVGVDISNEAIQYAINKYKSRNTEFFVCDFFENKFTKDIVVSFETIEHINNHSINEILDQLISYCKYILIGSVPFKEVEGNNPYHYFFNLDETDLAHLSRHGKMIFYYQSPDGEIYTQKNISKPIQNIIFVVHKFQLLKQ